MDSTGNRNMVNARLALYNSSKKIYDGIAGLAEIHAATVKLVDHEGGSLEDNLESADVLRTYVLALIVEAGEFIQTLDWKPWRKNPRVTDMDKTLDEFADILAFIGMIISILDALGVNPDEIAAAYLQKEHINIDRFQDAMRARERYEKLS